MGVYSGPEVSNNGLVLALDAGNTKSYDKYENLLTNSSSTSSWVSGTFTTETTNRILNLNTVRVIDLTSDGDSPNLTGTSSISPGTYTVSHYIDTANSTSTSVILYIFTFHALNGGFTFSNANSTFTLSTKTFSPIGYSGPAWSNASVSAVNCGNGIYRISITATTSLAGTGIRAYITPSPQDTSYLLVAGSQYESGSIANDYYATTGTAKTRGSTITDMSGNGNNGTLTNGPTFSSSNGGSIVFDGTNDVSIITSPTILQNQNFTISAWINPGVQNAAIISIIDFDHGASQGWVLQSEDATTNRNYYLAWYDGTQYQPVGGLGVGKGIQLTTSVWQNVTYTKNGTTLVGYLNGNQIYTPAAASNGNVSYITNRNLGIGDWILTGRAFKGNVSNTQIYNRALTASEIQQNFNASRGRFGV